MTSPFGGSIPDEIVLDIEEAKVLLFTLDDAIEQVDDEGLRTQLEAAARIIVEKLLPDLPDL